MTEPVGLTATEWRSLIKAAQRALINGSLQVSYRDDEGQAVSETYRSVAEIERAIEYARRELAKLEGTGDGQAMVTVAGGMRRC
ncbi:MAG: hypothetical protein AAFW01_00065 [Pseudomonadota bacterium]